MKKLCLALMALLLCSGLSAQELQQPQEEVSADSLVMRTFIEQLTELESDTAAKVTLVQDTAILALLGQPGVNVPQNIVIVQNHPCLQMMGYRIQVFSSNNQYSAKTEAFRRETAIKQSMPDMPSYVRYQAPFWRVRVGDFQTYEDAYAKLVEFRKTFAFGREMSIVRETINLPL